MCSVSVIHDYFHTRTTPEQWTPSMWEQLQEVLRRLNELDAKLDQPDCHDPAKAAWMREVEARLAELEQK